MISSLVKPMSFTLSLCVLLTACVPVTQPQPAGPTAPAPGQVVTNPASAQPAPASPPSLTPPIPGPAANPVTQPSSPVTSPALPVIDLSKANSVRVSASNRFLKSQGESVELIVEVLDAEGKVLAGKLPLNWTSSRPGDFSVDAQGRVMALIDSGYSEIRASLDGTPLSGAVIINVFRGGGGSSGGGGGTTSPTIVLTPPVILSMSASPQSVTGAGVPVRLSADAGTDVTLSWSCLGTSCSNFVIDTDGTVYWRTPATPGTYQLELAATRNGLISRQTIDITVSSGSVQTSINTGTTGI